MEPSTATASVIVFVATDRDGNRRYVESTGDNIAAARYRLEIQGYTEIEVVKDGFDEKLGKAIGSDDAFDSMTLHERVEFERRCAEPGGHRFVAWQFFKSEALTILGIVFWVWCRASGATPWSAGSFSAYTVALGYLALVVRVRIPARLYDQLLEARAWHRWDEVEATVKKIRSWRWFTGEVIPSFEMLFSDARVLAGRGDLPAALEKVKPLEDDPDFDRAVFYGLLGSLFDIAHDLPGRKAVAEKMLALDPKSPVATIELATTLALHGHDPARAREVLAALDPADVKPFAQPHLDLVAGVIALDEGRAADAEKLLASADEGWRSFAGNPLAKGFARILQGYHAVALRRLGRTVEAADQFTEVRAFLEAVEARDLLRRWAAL